MTKELPKLAIHVCAKSVCTHFFVWTMTPFGDVEAVPQIRFRPMRPQFDAAVLGDPELAVGAVDDRSGFRDKAQQVSRELRPAA